MHVPARDVDPVALGAMLGSALGSIGKRTEPKRRLLAGFCRSGLSEIRWLVENEGFLQWAVAMGKRVVRAAYRDSGPPGDG